MDKRSILFLACVSAAYFAIHTIFGTWQGGDDQVTQEKKIAFQREIRAEKLEKERLRRTASISEFPLTDLLTHDGEKIITAFQIDDLFVTLPSEASIPSTLFSKGKTLLAIDSNDGGAPLIYQSKNAKPVEVPGLSSHSFVELQLLSLEDMTVTVAEKRGADLVFPYSFLDKSALALVRNDIGFTPVGIYDPSLKKIVQFGDFDYFKDVIVQKTVELSPSSDSSEEFYVIENELQQLVFSTKGGSLSEINLPLQSSKDSKSIVKEIDIDREILSESPQNARFPLHPYNTTEGLQSQGKLGGFYPLLGRAILNPNGTERSAVSPSYYALNIISQDEDIANLNFRVTDFTKDSIRFEASSRGRRISKKYTLSEKGPYCLDLEISIDGNAEGLWLTSGVPDVELVGGSYVPQLKYQLKVKGGADVEEMKLPKSPSEINTSVSPYWVSNCNGFLGLILDPLNEIGSGYQVAKVDGMTLPTRLSLVDSAYNLYPPANYPGYATLLPMISGKMNFRVFAGPYDEALLKRLDDLYEDLETRYNPEYALAISIQGWFSFISQPFSKFLFFLMQVFFSVTSSWAVSIILLTIALRAMMYPLNNWSIKSNMKMQEIAPKIKAVQERYKKDPKRSQMEVMKLYKESGVNPFGGCLPMLLQMPFLIGMFYMLKSSFPLRGAVFISGWIDDLAAPDVVFSWGQHFWIIGNEFHLLPILTGAVMFIQGKMTQTLPKDGSPLTDAQKQQKMMGTMMAVLFTVMFYNFPSGLNIYFMFSTLLGILQQKFLTNKHKQKPVAK
jgi:YidC/Oxa1 family membrane protein insertase